MTYGALGFKVRFKPNERFAMPVRSVPRRFHAPRRPFGPIVVTACHTTPPLYLDSYRTVY